MEVWKGALSALIMSVAVAGCGGGDGPATDATAAASPPPPPVAIKYLGTMSFGDTISITMDAPSAGKLKLSFVNSAFGLRGTVIGDYTSAGSNIAVSELTADSADPPPAGVTARLSGISLAFRLDSDGIIGEIAGVPNLLGTSTGLLAGSISASVLSSDVPALRSLAGTYIAVTNTGMYDKATGKSLASSYSYVVRILLDSNGNLQVCTGADPSTCAPQSGRLKLADQTRFPGAFDLTSDTDVPLEGRLFAGLPGSLRLDLNGGDSTTLYTGVWTLQAAKALAAGDLDGTWSCSWPNQLADGKMMVGDGTLARDTLTISSGSVKSATSGRTLPLTLNTDPSGGATFDGVGVAIRRGTIPPADPAVPAIPAPVIEAYMLLKTTRNSLAFVHYGLEVDTTSVAGTCRR